MAELCMRADGSFYAMRLPNSCSIYFLKDIIILQQICLDLYHMTSVVFSTTNMLINKINMIWSLNYELKSAEANCH